MSDETAKSLEEVRTFPPADRSAVLDGPMSDFDLPGEDVSPDEWKAAWHDEIVSRLDAYDWGEVKALTIE